MKPVPKPTKKPKTKKHKKKTPRQVIVKDLDILAREIVFYRDPQAVPLYYRIESVGDAYEYAINHRGVDQPGHIISRAKISVRWDLYNLHKQDANDNMLHEFYPEVYTSWFCNNFGLAEYDRMVIDSRVITKYSMDDLETLYFEMTEVQKWQEETGKKAYFSQKDIMSGKWRTL